MCTDFLIKAKDGSAIVARSMEFPIDTKAHLLFFPKGDEIESKIPPGGRPGISWTSKYDYLGIKVLGIPHFVEGLIDDGLNEKGLCVGGMSFTDDNDYQEYKEGNSLALTDLVKWLLGNFEIVDEVRDKISSINVVKVFVPELLQVPGIHFAVHDANGESIVIEFIKGEQKIHINPLGVMTNQPDFDWQLTNLRNYIRVGKNDIESKTLGEIEIKSTGSGNGWLGLPGDWTPPSRFVRTALFVHKAPQPQNAAEALNLANHIAYTVDIPRGLIELSGRLLYEFTQWVVFKDLNNVILYYRSYKDGTLKMVDMNQLKPGSAEKSLSMEDKEAFFLDKTSELK